jgi:hypothetical protein
MRLTRKAALFGATFALASVFTLAACSDDTDDASQDLSGDYVVTGFGSTTDGSTPVVIPSSGTATLSFNTYDISINETPPYPSVVSTGTYTANQNGNFTQNGTTSIGGAPAFATQCTGTWVINNEVTTLDTTCSGARSIVQLEPAI